MDKRARDRAGHTNENQRADKVAKNAAPWSLLTAGRMAAKKVELGTLPKPLVSTAPGCRDSDGLRIIINIQGSTTTDAPCKSGH